MERALHYILEATYVIGAFVHELQDFESLGDGVAVKIHEHKLWPAVWWS